MTRLWVAASISGSFAIARMLTRTPRTKPDRGELLDLVRGALPGLIVRLLLAMYAEGDARREEYLGEFSVMPWRDRLYFAGAMIPTALVEGAWPRFKNALGGASRRRGPVPRIYREPIMLGRVTRHGTPEEVLSALAMQFARDRFWLAEEIRKHYPGAQVTQFGWLPHVTLHVVMPNGDAFEIPTTTSHQPWSD